VREREREHIKPPKYSRLLLMMKNIATPRIQNAANRSTYADQMLWKNSTNSVSLECPTTHAAAEPSIRAISANNTSREVCT